MIIVRAVCLWLVFTTLSFSTVSIAKVRNASVTLDTNCGAGGEIDFNGLAYFCYVDQSMVAQLYRSNGQQTNWQAMTDFNTGSATGLRVVFKTENALFFTVLRGNKWHLFKTNGQPGDHQDLGVYEGSGRTLDLIASDSGIHYLRSGTSLFAANEDTAQITFIASTTLDSGIYRSDVVYQNGYLYYVTSNSPGYWNLVERVDKNGKRELLREFPGDTDTTISPIITSAGFTFANRVGQFFVNAMGVVQEKNFVGFPVGKVGSTFLVWSYGSELGATKDFDVVTPLGNSDLNFTFTQFVELGNFAISRCCSGRYVVSDGTAAGTVTALGTPLFDTVKEGVGMLVKRGTNQLYFLDKRRPRQSTLIAQFEGDIAYALARDQGSYYVITENEKGNTTKLWRAYRDGSTPTLLRSTTRRISFARTEAQRLYFAEQVFGLSSDKAHLWHSDGTLAFTYMLKDTEIELPSLDWLPTVLDLVNKEHR